MRSISHHLSLVLFVGLISLSCGGAGGESSPISPTETVTPSSGTDIEATHTVDVTPTESEIQSTPSSSTKTPSESPSSTTEAPTPTVTIAQSPTPTEPPGTPIPLRLTPGTWEPVAGDATTLALPLPDHMLLSAEAGGKLAMKDPLGAWGSDPGVAPESLTKGAWLGQGKVLLAGAQGSYVAEGARVSPSGLDGAIGGAIQSVISTHSPSESTSQAEAELEDVWMVAQSTLFQLVGGVSLRRFDLGALPIAKATLAWGPSVFKASGEAIPGPALWVLSGGSLYGLTLDDDGALSAWQRPLPGSPGLGLSAAGERLYALGGDGALYEMDAEGWALIPSDIPFVGLSGRFNTPGLWLLGEHGDLFIYRPGEGLTGLDGQPEEPALALLGVDEQGRALIMAGGVQRVSEGRPLFIHGLEPGGVLESLSTLTLLPTAPEDLSALEVSLDGEVLDSASGGTLTFSLSPLSLEGGSHQLVGVARYADGDQVTKTLDFTSIDTSPPTWGEDIEPIFMQSCAQCHGEGGFAHALYAPESWEAEIANILLQVEAGAMPLGDEPLTSSEIDRIRAWADTGFGR